MIMHLRRVGEGVALLLLAPPTPLPSPPFGGPLVGKERAFSLRMKEKEGGLEK